MPPHYLPLIVALLTGCAQFPQLDATITPEQEVADYPALVPIQPLLAQAQTTQRTAPAVQANLEGRVARLRARAARLRGSVLSGRERTRLAQGLR